MRLEKPMEQVLARIGTKFNEAGLIWGVGASMVLYYHGLGDHPSDIDLFVALPDWSVALQILQEMGEYQGSRPNANFPSKKFGEFVIDSVDVDLIGDFVIHHRDICYEYLFDEQSSPEKMIVRGVPIPVGTLEDWLVLYYLMPGRQKKYQLILDHLRKCGLTHQTLLKRAMTKHLPEELKTDVYKEKEE